MIKLIFKIFFLFNILVSIGEVLIKIGSDGLDDRRPLVDRDF